MSTLTTFDRHRQCAALGYIELEMFQEAEEELAGMSPQGVATLETIILRLHAAQQMERWDRAASFCGSLVELQPDQAEWRVLLAYATRRSRSVDEARAILEKALVRHPKEAIIHFNLGCYACLQGDLIRARALLLSTFRLDASFVELAQHDEDLAVIWAELPSIIEEAEVPADG